MAYLLTSPNPTSLTNAPTIQSAHEEQQAQEISREFIALLVGKTIGPILTQTQLLEDDEDSGTYSNLLEFYGTEVYGHALAHDRSFDSLVNSFAHDLLQTQEVNNA